MNPKPFCVLNHLTVPVIFSLRLVEGLQKAAGENPMVKVAAAMTHRMVETDDFVLIIKRTRELGRREISQGRVIRN